MDETAICLPWDKNFILTPLGQTVVYGELRIYKRMRRYPGVSIPPGTDTEKSSIIKWNSPLYHYTTSYYCTWFTVGYTSCVNWAIPFNKGTPHMDERAICLPWDKMP